MHPPSSTSQLQQQDSTFCTRNKKMARQMLDPHFDESELLAANFQNWNLKTQTWNTTSQSRIGFHFQVNKYEQSWASTNNYE